MGATGSRAKRATSFGAVADAYDAFRPQPPAQVAELLGPVIDVETVDLAAGTGLFTRFLVELGARVTAVEPDERMIEILSLLGVDAKIVRGSAEEIPLPDRSVDLVTVASAWHWFDPKRASLEVARILRPAGRLFTMWNTISYDEGEWTAELGRLRGELSDTDPARRPLPVLDLPNGSTFSPVAAEVIRWKWSRTPEQLIGLVGTWSVALTSDASARARFTDGVRSIIEAQLSNGLVQVPMACRCFSTTRS
jgi:SAM-dependent methyltransferase